ncbi:MAG: peptide chain release factor N(5)-glutamine methyltransferase [Clostridia bacterium]|nr:peptide chain release factor N(5)-glutamine methyltransferase [Clostridia bacterium]
MTIFEAYNNIKKELKNAGIDDDVFEAKQIIKYITGYNNSQILSNYSNELTEFQKNNLTAIMKQRLIHYPLQYILGRWDFYGRSYKVGPGVLIPRQDTETVIDVCLEVLKDAEKPKILDICAGTGCIGLTLAAETENSSVTLLEKYEEAARYLRENIKNNAPENAKLILADVFDGAAKDEKYDLIVSNPPYIKAEDIKNLQAEVKYEPETALAGGKDGLDFYRFIAKEYKECLRSGGALVFEIGFDQGEAVKAIMEAEGFNDIKIVKDYSENDRVVFGTVN